MRQILTCVFKKGAVSLLSKEGGATRQNEASLSGLLSSSDDFFFFFNDLDLI